MLRSLRLSFFASLFWNFTKNRNSPPLKWLSAQLAFIKHEGKLLGSEKNISTQDSISNQSVIPTVFPEGHA